MKKKQKKKNKKNKKKDLVDSSNFSVRGYTIPMHGLAIYVMERLCKFLQ